MNKQVTIYAVNAGCYSDYRVVALFTTKQKAEQFMAAVPDSDYNRIEEYELNPPTADLVRRGYSAWLIWMLRDGTVEKAERRDIGIYTTTTVPRLWRRTHVPAYKDKGIPDCLTTTVLAKTERQAIKIANEQRARLIADGQWNDPAPPSEQPK